MVAGAEDAIWNKIVGFGLAAAAVVAVVLIGSQLLGSPSGGLGGPGDEPTPAPEESVAEPSSSASVALRPLPPVECAELEAGTYRAAIGDSSVTVSVPTGWKGSSDQDGFNVNSRGSCLFAGGVTLDVLLVVTCTPARAMGRAQPLRPVPRRP